MRRTLVVVLLVLGWLFYVYSVQPPAGSTVSPGQCITAHAQPYAVVQEEVGGLPGRVRMHYEIISQDARNFEQFGHTAMRAAIDKWRETQAQVVYVMLNPSPGLVGTGDAYAIARYAPDGGGHSGDDEWIWEVEAMKGPYTDQEINITEMWHLNHDQFIEDNGISADEPRLKAYIAEEMDISVEVLARTPIQITSDFGWVM